MNTFINDANSHLWEQGKISAVCACVLVTQLCPTPWNPMEPARLLSWDSPGKNTGVDSYSLLQGIFPIQGSNPGLLHSKQILYPLGHQGSPTVYY